MIRSLWNLARAVWATLSPIPPAHPAEKSNDLIDYEIVIIEAKAPNGHHK